MYHIISTNYLRTSRTNVSFVNLRTYILQYAKFMPEKPKKGYLCTKRDQLSIIHSHHPFHVV